MPKDAFGINGECSICRLSEIDTLNYGEIHRTKEIAVHLFCLYFSTNLHKLGPDTSGIGGFQYHDIRRLIKSCAKVQCCYCHKGAATTHCLHPNCGRVFHQVCGFKANARFEYVDTFRTFCDIHNQIENESLEYPEVIGCWICYEALGEHHPVTTVPSCCGKWFHQQCLRTYAIHAGCSFKCPTCWNKNYADFARRHGIYVPEYKSLWEKTHDYTDIERFYTHCDAKDCLCPDGRTFTNSEWNLQLCSCCGSYGFHRLCRPQTEQKDIVICDNCSTVHISYRNESQTTKHQNASSSAQNVTDKVDTVDDDLRADVVLHPRESRATC